ncbi:MAG: zinc ribbon domain-containing protein, partial [Methanobrevibacter sp.]|nr:zinc ribbon domain-containing protein [Methanobrevibacter sp.]
IGYFALNNAQSSDSQVQASSSSENTSVSAGESSEDSQEATTQSISKTESESKDWELIGSYSGSGSGSQSISVPAGEIMIKLSAYPIKNYATNHLYVTGSNGESAGVDWGSTSAVETRSNSLSYSSSSPQTFTIDYYETVSWQVEFYRYQ